MSIHVITIMAPQNSDVMSCEETTHEGLFRDTWYMGGVLPSLLHYCCILRQLSHQGRIFVRVVKEGSRC